MLHTPSLPSFSRLVSAQAGPGVWKVLLRLYIGAFLLFLYGPLVVLVILSFNDSDRVGWPFKGATLKWYAELWRSSEILFGLANSLCLGLVVSILSCLFALTLSFGLRARFLGKPLLLQIIVLPIIVPGVVGGIVMLIFLGYLGVPFGLYTSVLIAQATWVMPFAFLMLYPRILSFDVSLEEAAMDLGAEGLRLFLKIILPNIMPGILATAIFCFTLSFDEFVRTVFVIGPDPTLPVQLWSFVTQNVTPFVPAVGVLSVAASTTAALVGFWLSNRAAAQSGNSH